MKNLKKIILVAFLIMVSLSLCSCDMLDEIRDTRIEMAENGTILYDDKEYKLLSNPNNYLISLEDGRDIDAFTVVDEEVPLLLTDMFGTICYYDDNLDIIYLNGEYYCTEEKYDKYSNILLNGKLDRYKIDYLVEDLNYKGEYVTRNLLYIFDKKTVDKINCATFVMDTRQDTIYNYDYIMLDRCDETGFIVNPSVLMLYRDKRTNEYGVMVYDQINDVYKGNVFTGQDKEDVAKVFDKYYYNVSHGFKNEAFYQEIIAY